MSLSITANAVLHDSEDGGYVETVVVTVDGRNLSTELINQLAAHAGCMEMGSADYEFEEAFYLDSTNEGPERSVVIFKATDQS